MEKRQARHQSRMVAVQALFTYFARKGTQLMSEVRDHVAQETIGEAASGFTIALTDKVQEEQKRLDVVLRSLAQETRFEKIAPIHRTIILLGMTELKYFETPPVVVIDEYVELAKQFGEVKSAGFINGVLDAFHKNLPRHAPSA